MGRVGDRVFCVPAIDGKGTLSQKRSEDRHCIPHQYLSTWSKMKTLETPNAQASLHMN